MPVFHNFSTEASGIINRLSTSLPVRSRRPLQDLIPRNCAEAAALDAAENKAPRRSHACGAIFPTAQDARAAFVDLRHGSSI
jgi:hypothetical protein